MPRLSPLASPSATTEVLNQFGLATKHALGQNFLVNDAILQKIVSIAELSENDALLEIGPGIGTLTIALLKSASAVVSIERDADLPQVLAQTCSPWEEKFALINKDALEVDSTEIENALHELSERSVFGEASAHGVSGKQCVGGALHETSVSTALDKLSARSTFTRTFPNKLVANLPYAVAATLVLDYFERFPHLESATVMVQKEVADRMMARPGSKDYGAFTVKLSLYARASGHFLVSPSNFFPPPRVMSCVLRLDRYALSEEVGIEISPEARRAECLMADGDFANRRKTIANSAKTYFASRGVSQGAKTPTADTLARIFTQADIDPQRRGETLTVQEYVSLGRAYLKNCAK